MAGTSTKSSLSLRDVFGFLFKYKRRMIVTFLTVFILVSGGIYLMQPMYQSKAKLIIKIGRENVYDPVRSDSPALFDFSVDERINSKVELMTGTNAIQSTLKAVGLKNVYPDIEKRPFLATRFVDIPLPNTDNLTDMERAILLFNKNLEADRVSKSDMVEVRYDNPDPVIAQKSLQALIKTFIADHVRVYQEPERYNFLEQQVNTLQAELRNAENDLESFKSENSIASLFQEKTIMLELKAEAETDLLKTESDISENQGKLAALESSKGFEYGEETDLNPLSISEIRRMLAELKLREQEYLNIYTEENPKVIGVREEIAAARGFLEQEERSYHNKAKLSLEHTLTALRTKQAKLKEQLADYERRLAVMVSKEMELKRLERQVSIKEDSYDLYVKKLEESRISREMDEQGLVNISLAEPPTLPIEAVKPKLGIGMAVAGVLGILAALLLALYSEYFSHAMNSPQEVWRHTGLDVAADLPDMD